MTPTSHGERAAALDAALAVLACPVCLLPLERDRGSLVCGRGHRHDVARAGYASLAPGSRARGDSAAMVALRRAFLAAGHLDAVDDAIAAVLPEAEGWCVDVAGGPGSHLARLLDARPALRGLGLDVSPAAARAAAGAHPRAASATADVWRRLPVGDATASAVVSAFGPRNGAEFARVLAPGGRVVVVSPLPAHLAELRGPFGTLGIAPDKAERLADRLSPLVAVGAHDVVDQRLLRPEDAAAAVLMGPSGHHLDPASVEATAASTGPIAVTVAVRVAVLGR